MKNLSNIFTAIMCAFLLWLGVSWIDVVSDNLSTDPQHSNINAFVLLVDFMEEENS